MKSRIPWMANVWQLRVASVFGCTMRKQAKNSTYSWAIRGWVESVSFSHDGNTLASGSSDNTVRLWDMRTGAHLRTFEGHTDGQSTAWRSVPMGKRLQVGVRETRLYGCGICEPEHPFALLMGIRIGSIAWCSVLMETCWRVVRVGTIPCGCGICEPGHIFGLLMDIRAMLKASCSVPMQTY